MSFISKLRFRLNHAKPSATTHLHAQLKPRRPAGQKRLRAALVVSLAVVGTACANTGADSTDMRLRVALDIDAAPGPIFDSVNYQGGLYTWMSLIYGTMALDTSEGLRPGLATDWKFPDNRTVVLTLREGVTFQDGTPFNAAAVKKSWDRVIASKTMVKAAGIAAMESIEIEGDYSVTVRLNANAAGDWRDRLLTSADTLAVASPAALDKLGEAYSTAPVGAGPYRLEKYSAGQRVILTTWDGFYDPKMQQIGTIEFIQTDPGAATVASLVGRQVDLARVSSDDAASLQARRIGIQDVYPNNWASSFLAFCTKGPLAQLDARKAIAYAINTDEYIERGFNGLTEAASFPVNRTSPYYQEFEPGYTFDLTKAKELAASSGLTGRPLKFLVGPNNLKAVEVIQSQLGKIGVDVQIENTANIFKAAPTAMPDIMLINGGNSTGYGSFVLPQGPANWCHNDFPAVSEAWAATRNVALDKQQLSNAWADFQTALNADLPLFVFAASPDPVAYADSVEGVDDDTTLGQGSVTAWTGLRMVG